MAGASPSLAKSSAVDSSKSSRLESSAVRRLAHERNGVKHLVAAGMLHIVLQHAVELLKKVSGENNACQNFIYQQNLQISRLEKQLREKETSNESNARAARRCKKKAQDVEALACDLAEQSGAKRQKTAERGRHNPGDVVITIEDDAENNDPNSKGMCYC